MRRSATPLSGKQPPDRQWDEPAAFTTTLSRRGPGARDTEPGARVQPIRLHIPAVWPRVPASCVSPLIPKNLIDSLGSTIMLPFRQHWRPWGESHDGARREGQSPDSLVTLRAARNDARRSCLCQPIPEAHLPAFSRAVMAGRSDSCEPSGRRRKLRGTSQRCCTPRWARISPSPRSAPCDRRASRLHKTRT